MSKSRVITLYKNHKHSIGTWKIWYETSIGSAYKIMIAHAQVIGGTEVTTSELINQGKQSRSVRGQTIHRMKSRINKQLDKGYVKTQEAAKVEPTNAMDMPQPMLALAIKRVSTINWTKVMMQPKLDGHRCLIASTPEGLIAYSRQGKPIDTIDHILNELDFLPIGTILDGELYVHDTPLQTIASWVKRFQTNTLKIYYVVYDCIRPEPYALRLAFLQAVFDEAFIRPKNSLMIDTYTVDGYKPELDPNRKMVYGYVENFMKQGYEGLIIRQNTLSYEAGRRSKSLIKVKIMEDSEFVVQDITLSDKGRTILHMQTKDKKWFKATAPGTEPQKEVVWTLKDQYIGKIVTIKYPQLTNDGIPFQPVATRWRVDL